MKRILGLIGLSVLIVGSVDAQTTISWSQINSGGGATVGGVALVNGSLGGTGIGSSTSGTTTNSSGFWTGVPTTLFSALPFLRIELTDGSKLQLSWPVTAEGFSLERATTLAPPDWALLRADINVDQGMNFVHEEAVTMHFYRLMKE